MRPTEHTLAPAPQPRGGANLDKGALQTLLEHRFRHTLRSGQVSPLLHLVLRYRQEAPACTPNT